MNNFAATILIPSFIIFLVTYQAVQSAFNFGSSGTLIMAICVSLLSVIGLSHNLKGSLNVVLLPYTALVVGIEISRSRKVVTGFFIIDKISAAKK